MATSIIKRSLQGPSSFVPSSRDSIPLFHDDRTSQPQTPWELSHPDDRSSNVSHPRTEETLDIRKPEQNRENSDSINDFYNRGRPIDDKVQQKRYVDFREGEPMSLVIHNDISQKLVQKRQNESCPVGSKNKNSYDKKLNQPNIKPSVSNVFSSLNDYINAPSGSIEKYETPIDILPKPENANTINERIVIGDESIVTPNSEPSTSSKTEETNKFINSGITRYQNILLPVKYDTETNPTKQYTRGKQNLPEATDPIVGIVGNSAISLNTPPISVHSGGVSVNSGTIPVNSLAPDSLENKTVDHVYENVYLPKARNVPECEFDTRDDEIEGRNGRYQRIHTDNNKVTSIDEEMIPKSTKENKKIKHGYENVYLPEVQNVAEVYAAVTSYPKVMEEAKHIYENLDQDPRSQNPKIAKIPEVEGKSTPYKGNDKALCETSQDHESVPKSTKKIPETEARQTAPLVDRKPVVGFSTIDDLSEEELNKYLAELEAEERAIEGKAQYENVAYISPAREDGRRVLSSSRNRSEDDEDANEAPIFETVTIGELPSISEQELQVKAKKFPVIDYNKAQGSSSGAGSTVGFLETKAPEKCVPMRTVSEARVKEKRSKKIGDRKKAAEEVTEVTEPQSLESLERRLEDPESLGNSMSHSCNHVERKDSRQDLGTGLNEMEKHEDVGTGFLVEECQERPDSVCGEMETDSDTSRVDCKTCDDEGNLRGVGNGGEEDCNYSGEDSGVSGETLASENGYEGDEIDQNGEDDVEDKPSRPQTLNIVSSISMDDNTTIGKRFSCCLGRNFWI